MTSSDDRKAIAIKVIIQGACDYIVKPIRLEVIQLLWQHVVRKRNNICVNALEQFDSKTKYNLSNKQNSAFLSSKRIHRSSNGEKGEVDVDEGVVVNGPVAKRKSRMIWTDELRQQFATIVNQIGPKSMYLHHFLDSIVLFS